MACALRSRCLLPGLLALGLGSGCGSEASPPSRVEHSEPAPQPPSDELDEDPAPRRLEIAPTGLWHGELATSGGPLGFELQISKSGGQYVARLPNGDSSVTLTELRWADRELVLSAPAGAELRAVHDGQRMRGSWSKPLDDRSSIVAFTALPGLHPRLECDGAVKGAPTEVSGTWELRVGEDQREARLELREVELDSGARVIHANLSPAGAEARSFAGCYAGGALALSRFDGASAELLEAEIDGAGRLRGRHWVDTREPASIEGARAGEGATKTRRSAR